MTPTAVIQCRACKGTDVRRSHRTGLLEHLYALGGFYPYRCHGCQTRFFLAQKTQPIAPASERRAERKKLDRKRVLRLVMLFALSLILFLLFAWKFILPEPPQSGRMRQAPGYSGVSTEMSRAGTSS